MIAKIDIIFISLNIFGTLFLKAFWYGFA